MKRPYLDIEERRILLEYPNSGYAQRLRFRLALENFKQAISKSIWWVLHKLYKWLDV